ncbi:MAG TPA: VCBS repeat-containing protein, partial [Candidatus Udaeobacter sp.]|nr:VCBS repeat-containing protein [Candidatus Udaeobacter sp.]
MSPSSAPADGGDDASHAFARRLRRHPVLISVLFATVLAAALSRGRVANPAAAHGSAAIPGFDLGDIPGGPDVQPFVPAGVLPAGPGPTMLAAADLDRDGDLDLVTTNLQGHDGVTVLVNAGEGAFQPLPSTPVPGVVDPGRFALTDLDEDGQLDLVIPGETSGNLAYLRNTGGGKLAKPELLALPSPTPAQAVAGDLDGDGRSEIVVAHLASSDQLTLVAGEAAERWGERTVERLAASSDIESVAL